MAKKNLFKQLRDGIKKSVKGIVKVGGKIYEAEAMVVLAPFKKTMMKQLDKRGIKHGKKMKDVARLFLKHVIKGKHNYENYVGDLKHFEDYEALETLENLDAIEMVNVPDPAFINNLDNLGEEEATNVAKDIINAVLDFFKTVLKKKQSGKPVSDEENEMAKDAEKGAENADKAIEKEQSKEEGKGGFAMDMKFIYIIVAIVLAYFIFMRKKSS